MDSRLKGLKFSAEQAYTWFFVCAMSSGLVRTVLYSVLSKVNLGRSYLFMTIFIMYFPIIIVFFAQLAREKKVDKELIIFIVSFIVVALYFAITLFIHPDYEEHYAKSYFGAYDAVFRPDNGAIFMLLAVLLCKNTERLRHNLRLAAPVLFVYLVYQFWQYKSLGYWMAYDWQGDYVEQSYNLGFGYTAMFCSTVMLVLFVEEHKWWEFVIAVGAFVLAILGGSRGCVLTFMVFVFIYVCKKLEEARFYKRLIICAAMIAVFALIYVNYNTILTRLSGVNSRAINMLIEGTFTADNGRSDIYKRAMDAISNVPLLGYGAYGDRPFIAPYFYWGYTHNIILEFIIDFGWIFGIGFLAALLFLCIKAVIKAKGSQVAVIAVLIGANAKLFISDSFWSYPYFWALFGYITYIMYADRKKSDIQRS